MFLSNYYKWKKAIQDLVGGVVKNWYATISTEIPVKTTSNTNAKIFTIIPIYDTLNNILEGTADRVSKAMTNNSKILWNPNILFSSDNNEPNEDDYNVSNIIASVSISNLVYNTTPSSTHSNTLITFTATNSGESEIVLNKFGVTRILRASNTAGNVWDNIYIDSPVLIAEGFLNSPITLAPGASESVYIELNEENSPVG